MKIMMTGTTDLADFLLSIGVDVIQAGQEIKCRCPMHLKRTGKEDNNPSFYVNSQTGLWLCYSCGARGNLAHLIREVTGKDDIENLTMLMEHNVRQLINPAVKWEKTHSIDFHMYLKYEDVPKRYLQMRNIEPETARLYGIRWNPEKMSWIIPIISRDNELLGWQEKGQTFVKNFPPGIKMRDTLFGIERLTSKTVILVESPLDVVRFASSFDGIQCLATFGASITREQLDLLYDVSDKLIVALDNDHAGVESAKKIFKDMPLLRKGVFWLKYSHTDAKDIGDMTDNQLEEAVREASIIPWWL